MSSFDEVRHAVVQVLKDDGTLGGTAFFILPGYAITCHHVIFGLRQLRLRLPGEKGEYPATYLPERSDPVADIAVLAVPDVQHRAVQLGHAREGIVASAYGYRPRHLEAEPEGHSFRGTVGSGQQLRLTPSAALTSRLRALPESQRSAWNVLPGGARHGYALNFDVAAGLEQGISGGPVYDPCLRRVVGLLRAVEGERLAYVIPFSAVLSTWPELDEENRRQVPDLAMDRLARLGISPVAAGATPVRALSAHAFEDLLNEAAARFGGRQRELAALDAALSSGGKYVFVTGLAGFGKTSLLAAWRAGLRNRQDVASAVHMITSKVDPSEDFCLRNLCEQLCEFHGLGGELPQTGVPLQNVYAELLALLPPPHVRLAVVLDGLDEAVGWAPRPTMFKGLSSGTTVVFSARTIVGRHWLAELKLTLEQVQELTLDRMTLAEVRDAARKNGLEPLIGPSFEKAVAMLHHTSEGDPFYLRYILEDVLARPADWQTVLEQTPIGVGTYLDAWWNQVSEVADDQTVADLLGYLLVAMGPLPRTLLVDVSAEDALTGASFDRTIRRVERHLIGDPHAGYSLCHPRFRDYIITNERITQEELVRYRSHLVAWCERFAAKEWPPDTPDYVLRHYAGHVMELAQSERGRIYAVARDALLSGRLRERFPDAPELALAPSEMALQLASADDDVGAMVEFLLTRVQIRSEVTTGQSPLDELARGGLAGALRLADFHEIEVRVLLYLGVAWELADLDANGLAVETLRRLADFPDVPRLTDERAELLAYLLAQVCDLDEDLYGVLCGRLVFDDEDRWRLCVNALARIAPVGVTAATEHHRWHYAWWSTWGQRPDRFAGTVPKSLRTRVLRAASAAACGIQKAWLREMAATSVVRAAIEAGDLDLAQDLAKGAPERRGALLVEIGLAFLDKGHVKRGMSLLGDSLSLPLSLDDLISVGAVLLNAGQREYAERCFDAARELITTELGEDEKDMYVLQIAAARARGGDFTTAVAVASEHSNRSSDMASVAFAALESMKPGDLQFALQTVERIPDAQYQATILAAIAKRHLATGNPTTARSVLERAENLARTVEDSREMGTALRAVASAMAHAGDSERALGLTILLDSFDEERILCEAVEARARLGDFSGANLIASSIHRHGREEALAIVAVIQAEAGEFEAALTQAQQVNDNWFGILGTRTVYAVASLQAASGNARAARRTIFGAVTALTSAHHHEGRTGTLQALVEHAVASDNLPLARRVADLLDDATVRFHALLRIASADAAISGVASEALAAARSLVPGIAVLGSRVSALLALATLDGDGFFAEDRLDALREAAAVTGDITDHDERRRSLEAVAAGYLAAGDPQAALALIDRIENREWHADALISLLPWNRDMNLSVVRVLAQRAFDVIRALDRDRDHRLTSLVNACVRAGDWQGAFAAASQIVSAHYASRALCGIAVAQAEAGALEGAEATFDRVVALVEEQDAPSYYAWSLCQAQLAAGRPDLAQITAGRFEVDHREFASWVAQDHLERGDPRQAFGILEGSLDWIDDRDANLGRRLGRALAATGDPKDLASTEAILAVMKESQYRDWLLGDLVGIDVDGGRYDEAFRRTAEMSYDEYRAEAFAVIAAGQARHGLGSAAVDTALEILTNSGTHLTVVADALAEAGDVKNLKRLLGRCGDSRQAAYGLCIPLAKAYPGQALIIAEEVARFGG